MLSNDSGLNVLVAAWAPFYAGAEVAAMRLAVGLREAGHRVTVVVGSDGETRERTTAAGLDVRWIPLALTDKFVWWRYQSAQRSLRRLMIEVQPDVVHANDLPTSQMVGQVAGKLGIPRICHHRWFFDGAAIDWLNKFGAERHLFVSQALMDDLSSASPQLASSCRAVVYDGLELPQLPTDADRALARRRLDLPPNRSLVLFAGQIIERKGVADLIRAWEQLSTDWSERADLILVGDDLEGDGRYRRQMEEMAAERGCGVRFVGFQRNVAEWIAAANVCVVPSHVEPLGNATLEAMAQGRPVVGTNVGGIPEMVVDGTTGLLVAPRDPQRLAEAIERLLREPDLADQLGRAAREHCERKFSSDAHVAAVVHEYRRAIEQQASVYA